MKKQLLIFFVLINAFAQAQSILVKDINLGNLSSTPSNKVFFKNEIYFVADDGIHGKELWKTDGTEAGTVLVKDIYVGEEDGIKIFKFYVTNNFLYFFAIENSNQFLYKTDGTSSGTEKIKQFTSISSFLDEVNEKVIFSAQNRLWATDGTEAGTVQIANYTIFGEDRFVKSGNEIYFSAEASSSIGKELYKTDGTSAGTVLVKNIRSGSADSFPNQFITLNGTVYFSANNGSQGTELWTTDGTGAGTVLVKDINIGSGSSFNSNTKVISYNNKIYFVYNNSLWTSDGTDAGTEEVKSDLGSVKSLFVVNNQILVFARNTSTQKQVVWVTDGTTANTTSFEPNYTEFSHNNQSAIAGNFLYFQGTTQNEGYELWKTDGTANGTVLVKDIQPEQDDNNIRDIVEFNGNVIFTANDGNNTGTELYFSDGTEAGTRLLKDINQTGNNGSSPFHFFTYNNSVLFSADNGTEGRELWIFDGTNATMLKDINEGTGYSRPQEFVELNGEVYFKATSKDSGRELWKTDGTLGGTVLVKDINPNEESGLSSFNDNMVVANNKLYFFANDGATGYELWESDGTESGTKMVKDINTGSGDCWSQFSSGRTLASYKNKVYFTAHNGDNDFEVWESDGTETGTKIHHHYNLSGSSNPKFYTVFNDFLYYNSKDDLIKSDGTTALKVSDTDADNLTVAGDKLYFTASFSDGGELWVTDGVSTYQVKDIRSGTSGSFPSSLTPHNNEIYFIANDGNTGNELWKSDGTESGTNLVKDIKAGGSSSSISGIISFDNKVLFGAGETNSASELWITDGTEVNTKIFEEINPSTEEFNSGSSPNNFYVFNDVLLFSANNGTNGFELFKLERAALSVDDNLISNNNQIDVYPNPSTSIVTIKAEILKIESIKIFSMLGKEVMQPKVKNNQVDISNLPKGIYLLQIQSDKTKITKKIIKN